MSILKYVMGWVMGLWSAWMALDGLVMFQNTSGVVQGSEFGMLITLSHQLSMVLVWLGLFALWSLLPGSRPRHESRPPT